MRERVGPADRRTDKQRHKGECPANTDVARGTATQTAIRKLLAPLIKQSNQRPLTGDFRFRNWIWLTPPSLGFDTFNKREHRNN